MQWAHLRDELEKRRLGTLVTKPAPLVEKRFIILVSKELRTSEVGNTSRDRT